jgi:hypothetical protein
MVVNCASQHSLFSDGDCTLTSSSRSCANCRDSQPSAASSPAASAVAERVICGGNCSLSVRALQLDQVRTQSLVAQQCARHASESMRCHFVVGVTRHLSLAMRGVDDVCRFDLFVGEGNERVDYSVMLSAAFDTGVNTVRHMPTRFRAFLPRSIQRHVRLPARHEQVFDTTMPAENAHRDTSAAPTNPGARQPAL